MLRHGRDGALWRRRGLRRVGADAQAHAEADVGPDSRREGPADQETRTSRLQARKGVYIYRLTHKGASAPAERVERVVAARRRPRPGRRAKPPGLRASTSPRTWARARSRSDLARARRGGLGALLAELLRRAPREGVLDIIGPEALGAFALLKRVSRTYPGSGSAKP